MTLDWKTVEGYVIGYFAGECEFKELFREYGLDLECFENLNICEPFNSFTAYLKKDISPMEKKNQIDSLVSHGIVGSLPEFKGLPKKWIGGRDRYMNPSHISYLHGGSFEASYLD